MAKKITVRLKIITSQQDAISELSTPVLPVWDGILVLPIIGTVDTQRAQQITENLLFSISSTAARVAILDITGLHILDTAVASHFIKTIHAAQMLGTEIVLTGITPTNAQTLVSLGVDLEGVVTKKSLKAGLQWAFEMAERPLKHAPE